MPFPIFFDRFHNVSIGSSPIEALVLGSLLTGVGYGLIISADTSTGGSDLLAAIVTRRRKFLTIGMVMNLLDFVVVTAGAFIDGISTLLPSIVAVLICNISIDAAAYGFGTDELPAWLSLGKYSVIIYM